MPDHADTHLPILVPYGLLGAASESALVSSLHHTASFILSASAVLVIIIFASYTTNSPVLINSLQITGILSPNPPTSSGFTAYCRDNCSATICKAFENPINSALLVTPAVSFWESCAALASPMRLSFIGPLRVALILWGLAISLFIFAVLFLHCYSPEAWVVCAVPGQKIFFMLLGFCSMILFASSGLVFIKLLYYAKLADTTLEPPVVAFHTILSFACLLFYGIDAIRCAVIYSRSAPRANEHALPS